MPKDPGSRPTCSCSHPGLDRATLAQALLLELHRERYFRVCHVISFSIAHLDRIGLRADSRTSEYGVVSRPARRKYLSPKFEARNHGIAEDAVSPAARSIVSLAGPLRSPERKSVQSADSIPRSGKRLAEGVRRRAHARSGKHLSSKSEARNNLQIRNSREPLAAGG